MQVQDIQHGGGRSLLKMYEASFKSLQTAKTYTYTLNKYANHDLESLLKLSQREAEDRLIDFIITNKENGMSWGALHNYVASVSKFYEINDVNLNMKRVKRYMPEQVRLRKDKAYDKSMISKMLEHANSERSRALILLLCSSGQRLGGIIGLEYGDLEDKPESGIFKITVYRNTNAEYQTYCTPEAKKALETYFDIRRRHGETISDKSPVIREQYNKESPLSVKYPKHTTRQALSKVLDEIMQRAGIRSRMTLQEETHPRANSVHYKKEVSLSSGFRKFFNTQSVNAKINPLIKEWLMGHLRSVGLEVNYYRPSEEQLQTEYEKAIELLTINEDVSYLKQKIQKLEVETLEQKDKEIEELRWQSYDRDMKHESEMEAIKVQVEELREMLLNSNITRKTITRKKN